MIDADSIHGVHPYPCKFPPGIARTYLDDAAVVLDPFCGSGTTLVEAARRGSEVIGFDCNPIAVLMSRFKLLDNDQDLLARCEKRLDDLDSRAVELTTSGRSLHEFAGRDHWFDPTVQRELAAILEWIREDDDERVQTWLETSLSAIVNRVSYQDGETRYARTERPIQVGETVSAFARKAREALGALRARGELPGRPRLVEVGDILAGLPLRDETVDLVVTSPPYANTMDYYLYHKQRMNILGYDFKHVQGQEIGSRWEFSSLKALREKWDRDYSASITEVARVLRPLGRAIFIIGDSQIAGQLVDAASLTCATAPAAGLDATVLESVSLSRRSRSFNAAFQRPNKREHVIELVKARNAARLLEDSPGSDLPEKRLIRPATVA